MFSILKHDVPVGKLATLNQDGTLHTETNGRLESALSTLHSIDHPHELKTIIESATGYEHICCGVTGHTDPVGVYPGAFVDKSVARDNKHYKFPHGKGLLCIDSDNITESIHDKLVDICPQMGLTASLETTSSSSNIYVPDKWLRGFTGTHTFLIIKDGRDTKRALQVLHQRAILNGYGQHRVSAVGGFLERSFIDTMLDKPSQPIYLRPNLGEGVFQDKKFVEYEGEAVLDSRKYILNLTPEEEETYQGLVELAKFEMQTEMQATREQWISEQPNRETAEKALSTQTLDGAFMIDVAYLGRFSVHDILMEPHKFHRKTCRDPFYDGEYHSKTIAMIFTDQQRSMINSHAHGGVVYQLLDPTMVGFGNDRVPVGDLYPDARLGDVIQHQPVQTAMMDNETGLGVPLTSLISDTSSVNQQALPEMQLPEPTINPVQPTDFHVPEQKYHSVVPIDSNSWIADHCNSQGKPRTTFPIFKFMVHSYGINIGYNVINKDVLMMGQGIHYKGDLRANANHGVLHNLCKLNQLDTGSIDSYISMMMMENEVNPVSNWVGSISWDGQSRIRALFDTLNVIENDMSYILFVKWLCGALRLAKGEIDRFEHVLVLQASKGGEGKSRWFNKLTPKELNNSMSLRLDDKDQLKEAVSYWIVELGELDSTFQKSEIKALMGFLSKNKDNIRLPYAKANNEYQRRSSYAGTVNNRNFLIDDSGDRRFWILETGDIDYLHDIDMQQVWAEVDTLDEQEWLTREQNDKIIELNKSYKMEDPLVDMLESYFSRDVIGQGTQHVNATIILRNAGVMNPNKGQLNKCGRWLRERGYKMYQKRVNGHQITGYDIPFFNEMLL